ncbi:MAG: sulfur carrier protein ThiS [Phycisphaerales bacterium]|nr:sulfur carrier protein ThiS [Phycisphaerales bacterium]
MTLNGRPYALAARLTVAALLRELALPPERVAVELNEQLVRRARFDETLLQAGDRVEIVTLVGGG